MAVPVAIPFPLAGAAFGTARKIASAHRRLIAPDGPRGPRAALPRTLVACSGGPDSCALVVALAHAGFPFAVGHVVHDMRPPAEAHADRDLARAAAARAGVDFLESTVFVRTGGNLESAARRERYRALAEMAARAACSCIATGHHADDQLETLLMSLLRGAGPHGLRGIAAHRRLPSGAVLVRPMLGVTRAEALEVCAQAGVRFGVDATNLDRSRFRAALREGPLREIIRLRPTAPARAARTARLMRDLAGIVDVAAGALPTIGPHRWERRVLRGAPGVIAGAALRRAFAEISGGRGADALRGRMVDQAVRIVRDTSTDPRSLDWPSGVRLEVTAHEVRLRPV